MQTLPNVWCVCAPISCIHQKITSKKITTTNHSIGTMLSARRAPSCELDAADLRTATCQRLRNKSQMRARAPPQTIWLLRWSTQFPFAAVKGSFRQGPIFMLSSRHAVGGQHVPRDIGASNCFRSKHLTCLV